MKKRIFYTIVFFISLITALFFLFPNESEEEIELGDNYTYIPPQDVTFDVTTFWGNGIFTYVNRNEIPVIFPNITSYKKDSLYIIVEQEFDFEETKTLLSNMIFNPNLYFGYDENFTMLDKKYTDISKLNYSTIDEEENYTAKIMREDSLISKMIKNKLNYYIIDKRNKKTIGPLTKEEFLIRKRELGVKLEF
jgi:hypothetical protein